MKKALKVIGIIVAIAGAAAAVLIVIYLSQFLWTVSISGNVNYTAEQILDICRIVKPKLVFHPFAGDDLFGFSFHDMPPSFLRIL